MPEAPAAPQERRATPAWRGVVAFCGLMLLFCLAIGAYLLGSRPGAVNLFITGDTQGFLVPCGCKTVPAGGLARRAGAMAALKALSAGEPLVAIEAGHGFADRGPARDALNREMGRFFARTGTRVGLGSYDLLLSPEELRAAAQETPLFLAGRPPHRGSEEVLLGGWGRGSLALGAARLRVVFLSQSLPEGVALRPPQEVLEEEMRANPADRYVVVGQLSPATVMAVLKAHPTVLLVVSQWQSTVTSMPQKAGGDSWVIFLGDRGRRAATARVSYSSGRWAVLPEMRYLGPETPSDARTSEEVASVLKQVEASNTEALNRAAAGSDAPQGFLGSAACGPCHAEAHRKWALSPHAKATKDLGIDHQEQNPECLRCHATGVGKADGYPKEDRAGVQCEACHGPGRGHPPGKMAVHVPDRTSCGTCHTERDSPDFDAEGYWKLIEHK